METTNQDIDKIAVILMKDAIPRKEVQNFVFEKIKSKPQIQTNHE